MYSSRVAHFTGIWTYCGARGCRLCIRQVYIHGMQMLYLKTEVCCLVMNIQIKYKLYYIYIYIMDKIYETFDLCTKDSPCTINVESSYVPMQLEKNLYYIYYI